MNILFYNTANVTGIGGGTERITERISLGLTQLGHSCYLAYSEDRGDRKTLSHFVDSVNISEHSIYDFILTNHIEVVILQKMTRLVQDLDSFRKSRNLSFHIISVLHFNPGYEEIANTFRASYRMLRMASHSIPSFCINLVRMLLFPLYKTLYPLRNKELYRTVYRYSDKVVLLSHAFIQEYIEYAHLRDSSKFEVIPNALSYDGFLSDEEVKLKENVVLIVSRLEEIPKRIQLSIQIWEKVVSKIHDDWKLIIVGDGSCRLQYEEFVNKRAIPNVYFVGRQEPKSYYKRAKIFLMTSKLEGWGLTLTEAQQFGCVPIAFDTYSSLADIITNDENGFVVAEGDVLHYCDVLKSLTQDSELWEKMSSCAIDTSRTFVLEKIVGQWNQLVSSK